MFVRTVTGHPVARLSYLAPVVRPVLSAWRCRTPVVTEIRLINRTRERAETLAESLGGPVTAGNWADRNDALDGAGLLVNTTSLGMTGQPPLEIDLAALPGNAVVNDIVYAPLETELLAAARARGNQTVDGIGMLLHQARPGFKAWFGQDPEVTPELREFVLGSV